MVKVSAFQSTIPERQFISQVPTQTYANYSRKEIDLEIKNNPYSFLNIIANKKAIDEKDKFKYIRNQINDFKRKKILIKQNEKSMYIYRQKSQEESYTGLICAISLKDYENNQIKAHEKTIKDREILFAKYLKEIKIHAEPVLITYNGNLNHITSKHINNQKQTYNFYTNDGTQHEIWEIKKDEDILDIILFFKKVQNLYIADGHHRMASSFRNNKNHLCLAYIVGKSELTTLPFHRKITNIKNADNVFNQINDCFNTRKIKQIKKNSEHLQFYINKNWYQVLFKKKQNIDLINNLLVSKLLTQILNPILNIKDERKNKNVHFIPANKDIEEEIKKLKKNDCFFLMNTIDIDTILKISNQNQTTPPKSTFILPKLPSGLIMMEL